MACGAGTGDFGGNASTDMESLQIQEGDRVVVTSPGGSMEGIAAAVRNNLPGDGTYLSWKQEGRSE